MLNLGVFQSILAVYIAIAIAKAILALPVLPYTIRRYHDFFGGSLVIITFLCVIMIPVVCAFWWPVSLFKERGRFLLMYTKKDVDEGIGHMITRF